jgi:hypothetical protein
VDRLLALSVGSAYAAREHTAWFWKGVKRRSGAAQPYSATGVVIVDQLAVRAGQLGDGLGVLGTERDAAA